MAFEVSYNLENEQQFWDGERTRIPCGPTTIAHANPTRRARRHRVNALSGT